LSIGFLAATRAVDSLEALVTPILAHTASIVVVMTLLLLFGTGHSEALPAKAAFVVSTSRCHAFSHHVARMRRLLLHCVGSWLSIWRATSQRRVALSLQVLLAFHQVLVKRIHHVWHFLSSVEVGSDYLVSIRIWL